MKKYILTIEYDEINEEVESVKEELITYEAMGDIKEVDISKLTTEDVLEIMFHKKYAKA
tara:strand:- start:78 stop:254 length:177 start_codon:yes stop_codon:yes gene_type:complete